jgi:hypothetical protein
MVGRVTGYGGVYDHMPFLLPGRLLALTALIRLRRRGRGSWPAMACVPQAMLYNDQLPLVLVARSYRECLFVLSPVGLCGRLVP